MDGGGLAKPSSATGTPPGAAPLFGPVDGGSDLPLFLQVVGAFECALRTGRLGAGQKLPTEAELGAQFGVSRKTLRRATDRLEKLGLIRRTRGAGTVVTEEARIDGMSPGRSLHAELTRALRVPETRLLSQARLEVDAALSRETGFHVGCALIPLRRLRLADGAPYAILENLVPARHLPALAEREVAGSVLDLRHRRGLVSALIRQRVDARLPDPDQAALLGIEAAIPVLRERIFNVDAEGEIFNLTINHYHPENYQMTRVAFADHPLSAAAADWR